MPAVLTCTCDRIAHSLLAATARQHTTTPCCTGRVALRFSTSAWGFLSTAFSLIDHGLRAALRHSRWVLQGQGILRPIQGYKCTHHFLAAQFSTPSSSLSHQTSLTRSAGHLCNSACTAAWQQDTSTAAAVAAYQQLRLSAVLSILQPSRTCLTSCPQQLLLHPQQLLRVCASGQVNGPQHAALAGSTANAAKQRWSTNPLYHTTEQSWKLNPLYHRRPSDSSSVMASSGGSPPGGDADGADPSTHPSGRSSSSSAVMQQDSSCCSPCGAPRDWVRALDGAQAKLATAAGQLVTAQATIDTLLRVVAKQQHELQDAAEAHQELLNAWAQRSVGQPAGCVTTCPGSSSAAGQHWAVTLSPQGGLGTVNVSVSKCCSVSAASSSSSSCASTVTGACHAWGSSPSRAGSPTQHLMQRRPLAAEPGGERQQGDLHAVFVNTPCQLQLRSVSSESMPQTPLAALLEAGEL